MVNVVGEALIDLVLETPSTDGQWIDAVDGSARYCARPGGSPFNVALGLARLGQPTRLFARLSSDAFGRQLRTHAATNGVMLDRCVLADEPTTLAVVGLDDDRNAVYDFYVDGTADWQWREQELIGLADDAWVHAGSLAAWTPPGAVCIAEALTRARHSAARPAISFDPNIRARLMPERPAALEIVEGLVGLSTVVKASAEDLAWLYPNREIAAVLTAWRGLGPELVVVTEGASGAHALARTGDVFTVASPAVEVADTVGAGDAFMAGLIDALINAGPQAAMADADTVRPVIEQAALVAALTCQRPGADPPTAAELQQALAR